MNKIHSPSHKTPEELSRLFQLACELHQGGKFKEAIAGYNSLLDIIVHSSLLHFNCGLAHFELQDFKAAESHYEKAVTETPEDPDIWYNRGLNFRRLKRYTDAADSFEEAFKNGDATVDTLYNLALCYQDLENYSEASPLYENILSQEPGHLSTLNNFAYLCHKIGDMGRTTSLYRQLLKHNPDHQAAKHMLSSLTGKTPESAPLEYVESVFDNYADTFEQSLVEHLHYQTPDKLYDLYCKSSCSDRKALCLDLGCGTGLAGEKFKTCCKKLIGVDISQRMLDIAREKNIYADLVKADIIDFLQQEKHATMYPLILAADVFTYMGDLEKVFLTCASSTEESGHLLFSVEENTDNPVSYKLKPTGRFGHSAKYIETLCKKSRWQISAYQHSQLRKDKGEWIMGHLYLLQKK